MMKMTEIADINPWWQHGKNFEPEDPDLKNIQGIYFQFRDIDLSLNNIYFICGPRRVGKTVYLKKIIARLLRHDFPPRQIYYLNAELFIAGAEIYKALEYFFEANRNKPQFYIFLDNFTLVRGWTDIIRRIISQGLIRNGTLIVTSSQLVTEAEHTAIMMEPQAAITTRYLNPMSFRSFVRQTAEVYGRTMPDHGPRAALAGLPAALGEPAYRFGAEPEHLMDAAQALRSSTDVLALLFKAYCATGGFPAAVNEHIAGVDASARRGPRPTDVFIRAILADCARQERKEAVVRHLMKLLLDQYGSRFSYLKLGRELEITHVTVIQYLTMLERQFLTETILAYDFHKRQPKTKGDKKVYIPDSFILSAAYGFATGRNPAEALTDLTGRDRGLDRIVEGVVISHLRGHLGKDRVWFYYDLAGKEIGAIADIASGFWGFHVDYEERGGISSGRKRIAAAAKYAVLGRAAYHDSPRWIQLPAPVFLALLASAENIL